MKALPKVFSIIDTETTGMRPGFARVMDIGIIRVENGKVVERYQTLVNPGMSVPAFISSFTGITDAALQDAPPFEEVALEIERLLQGAVFVAHNAAFDYGFIKAEFARIGMQFTAETLCTVQLSRALYPKEKSHSLDSLIARHGISMSSRHRALPDAEAVFQFLSTVSDMFSPALISRAVQAVRSGLTASIGKDSFTELPDSAGVYFFYGPEQELLYIGKSKHVRTRARSHFTSGGMAMDAHVDREVTSIETIKTSGELSALILEAALVKKESPLYNQMLRSRKVLVVAKKIRSKDGYDVVALEKSSSIEPDGTVLAVFRTGTQGKTVLRKLAKEHRLCEKLLGIEAAKGECFARQLGNCDGACIGALAPSDHNLRIAEAFKKRRIHSWPFSGPIVIREEESPEKGTIFFIDNWVLYGAFRYEDEAYQPLAEFHTDFDYDTYKILARYLRKRENRRAVHVVTQKEFKKMYAQCTGSFEAEIA